MACDGPLAASTAPDANGLLLCGRCVKFNNNAKQWMTQLIAAAPLVPHHPAAVRLSVSPRASTLGRAAVPWACLTTGVTDDLPVVKAFLDRAAAADLQVFFALNGMCPRPLSLCRPDGRPGLRYVVLTPSPGFFDIPPYNEPRGLNWTTSVVSTFKDHGAIASWYICKISHSAPGGSPASWHCCSATPRQQ